MVPGAFGRGDRRGFDPLVKRLVAPFDEPVGVQQQGRARRQRGGRLAALPVGGQHAEGQGQGLFEQLMLPAGGDQDRRRVPGAAVGDRPCRRIDDRAEHGGAFRSGYPAGEGIQVTEGLGGTGGAQQDCLAGRAELAHDRGRGQPAAHAVTDDDADTLAGQRHHVVPVAADFERGNRRGVSGREPVRQLGRGEDGVLEGEGDGAGLLVVPRLGEHLGQVAGEDREQFPRLGADRGAAREFRGDGR